MALLSGLLFFGVLATRAPMPGQPIYERVCLRCHGPEGRSDTAPTLVPFLWTYAQALDIVRHGGACGMPAFTESELSDEEVRHIVDYLKTLNDALTAAQPSRR